MRAIAALFGAVLLIGCSKHGQLSGPGNAKSSADTANRLPGTAPWSGHVLRGDDTEALRNYLRTVQEVKATVFDVHWNPATVAIDREAAIRSLRRVSRDGVTFVFAADEPAVRQLKPGSILWVRDLALRKVNAVDTQGGLTTVQTGVVSLNEAMPDAHIEFEAPVPVQNFLLSHREFPTSATNPPTSSLSHPGYGFVPALYTIPSGASSPQAPPVGTPEGAAGSVGSSTGSGVSHSGSTPEGQAGSVGSSTGGGAAHTGSTPEGQAGSVGSSTGGDAAQPGAGVPNSGSAPGNGAPNSGSAPGNGAPNAGNAPGNGAPNAGSAPGNGAPNAGNAPGNGAPNSGSAPGNGAPNSGSAPGGGAPNAGDAPGSGGDPADQKDEQSFGDNAYSGSLNGMQYSIGYKPVSNGAVGVTLEARDGEGGGGGSEGGEGGSKVFKHLFDISSDNVDVRFKVQADLSGFSAAGAYQIVGGNLESAKVQFKNLNGHVTAAFIGRLGQPGNKGLKIPIMHLPISFNVPLPIEGIPFVVQLGGDFLLSVFLAGNHATLSVNGAYNFNGQSGLTYSKASSSVADTSSIAGGQPEVTNYQGASLGVSAVMLAAQLPRIGFGLSVTGAASTIAFFDVVHVVTMTQAADAGAMMLTPRCKRISYNAVGHVGVETQVLLLPIPAVQQWATDKLSGKREVFNQSKEVLDPPVKGCEIK